MGYRRAESTETAPSRQSSEPFPVSIFGEPKPIADNKIGKHLTDEIFYYIDIHRKIKKFGLPHIYRSWLDAPHWLMDLHDLFESTETEYEHWQAKQYEN